MPNLEIVHSNGFSKPSKDGLFQTQTEGQKNLSDDPKFAYDLVLKLLTAYKELDDKKQGSKHHEDPPKKTHSLFEGPKSSMNPPELSLLKVDYTFTFCLLNLMPGEFYSSYQSFHCQFDSKYTHQLGMKEFQAMLDFLCSRENMGKTKVRKSFEISCPNEFQTYNKIALLNPSTNDHLEPFLKKGMFTVLSVKETNANQIGSHSYIHYLRFFPITLSYFSEYMKKRVAIRLANMEIICGLNSKKERIPCSKDSFLDKLEIIIGCKYNGDDYPTMVSFSSLEKALILFRNTHLSTFGAEQLHLILKELLLKCRVQDGTEREDRTIRLTYKLLWWISYRICLHCSLYALLKEAESITNLPRFKILEEYTIWAAAFNKNQFEPELIVERFRKYATKAFKKYQVTDLDDSEDQKKIKEILRGFLRKIFPHFSEQSIEKMFELFSFKATSLDCHNLMEGLIESIYDLIINVANQKLLELIATVYKSLKNASVRSEKPNQSGKWSNLSQKGDGERAASRKGSKYLSTNLDKEPEREPEIKPSLPDLNNLKRGKRKSKGMLFKNIASIEELDQESPEESFDMSIDRKSTPKSATSIMAGDRLSAVYDHMFETIDFIAEPSIRRRASVETKRFEPRTISLNDLTKKQSKFSSQESKGGKPSNLEKNRPNPLRIDLACIQEDCEIGKIPIKKSAIQKRLQMLEEEDITRNKTTGRETDVVKSLFIAHKFLEAYLKKQGSTPRSAQKNESGVSTPKNQTDLKFSKCQSLTSLLSDNKDEFKSFREHGSKKSKPRRTQDKKFEKRAQKPATLSSKETKSGKKDRRCQSTEAKALEVRSFNLIKESSEEKNSVTSTPLARQTQASTRSPMTSSGGGGRRDKGFETFESYLLEDSQRDSKASSKKIVKKTTKQKKKEEFVKIIEGYKLKDSDKMIFTRVQPKKGRDENFCGSQKCNIF